MSKSRVATIFLLLLLLTSLMSSCLNLEKVKRFRYEVTFKTEGETRTGFLEVSSFREGDKARVKIDFALGEEQLSTTVDLEGDDISSAILPLVMGNPTLATVLTPLGTVQGLIMAMSMGGALQVGFKSTQTDDKGETMEIQIPSSETRFGKEALWFESYVDGELAFRALIEKETFFPLVVDFRDPEILEAGQ
ncbi:MAG: hypothetical protein ABDK92_08450, partial [Atribacterota bacterium]